MKIEHTILGNDMQAVEIEMQPGQEIVAEASTLLMMEDGITFDAKIDKDVKAAAKYKLGGAIKAAA